jgi:nucleoside-diphosphate-sugar epimerase
MSHAVWFSLAAILLPLIVWYFKRLNASIQEPHRAIAPHVEPRPSDAELLAVEYKSIDDCKGLPSVQDTNYIVVGGSGSVGSALVEILHKHGARSIRILDIQDLPEELKGLEGVEFVKTDIRDAKAVEQAFKRPFSQPDAPLVVHLCSVVIRFWERLSYLKQLSFDVNVQGISNVIEAAKQLPGDKRLIYTSSAAVHFLKSNFFLTERPKRVFCRDGDELREEELKQDHYVASKRAAERLVVAAHGQKGLSTAILRPGMPVLGPRDLFIGAYLVCLPSFVDYF